MLHLRNFKLFLPVVKKYLRFQSSGRTDYYDECAKKQNVVIEHLPEREMVRLKGDDVIEFLQGLVTNDITQFQKNPNINSMYAMFLNKSGRVLYDTILYRTKDPDKVLIECDKNISNELRRHLRLHRVRRKLQIDPSHDEYKVWAVYDPDVDENEPEKQINELFYSKHVIVSADPRLRNLGKRIVARSDNEFSDLAKMYARLGHVVVTHPTTDWNYRDRRYTFGIAEGIWEMPPGKCFPLESNCDFLNGIDFHKGCYLGQELTARVYHTGVVRKRHMPVRFTVPPADAERKDVTSPIGAKVGTIIGATSNRALGLIRVERALHSRDLQVDSGRCYVVKPKWWPEEDADRVSIVKGS
ncbi:putative transferase CAF17, mitochondrial [Glossina fuscipes]|uniref:Transferase CAF17, mitochondrial n=1 Tax=Glossina fuscipes TaxID=7396 RepID=A0A8U0WII1_9MUSC|nr:putative transferase CAF17, mitochondrial [Glossina fuscipes]